MLCLPDDLEAVGRRWFQHSGIEKVIVPNSVKTLGEGAFVGCERLREIVFEPGSRLERIE